MDLVIWFVVDFGKGCCGNVVGRGSLIEVGLIKNRLWVDFLENKLNKNKKWI